MHPLQAVVHVLAILNAVDEYHFRQFAVGVGADRVDAVGTYKAHPDVVSGLVGLPGAAAQGQGHGQDSAPAGAHDLLHFAVDPVRALAALDVDFQLQCGKPGKLCTDCSRQAQGFGIRVLVAGFSIDGHAVPVLDGGLLLVGHEGLHAELLFNLVKVNHAFRTPRFCHIGSMA